MSTERTLILDHQRIQQKIKRMAYQLYEFNFSEPSLVLVAIQGQGQELAGRIAPILREISKKPVELIVLKLNKQHPLEPAELKGDTALLTGKSVILVDDVLNSGRTLIYGAKYLLDFPVKKITTVVLVDRRHRQFPVKADFVGLTLSTTLQDHIAVELNAREDAVYLE